MKQHVPLAVAFAAVAALSACDNHSGKSSSKATAPGAALSATSSEAATDTADCSPAPDAKAFAKAIKTAMIQIYGVDEAASTFTVSDIQPEGCGKVTLVYRMIGGQSQSAEATHAKAGGWYVKLFKTLYPVQ